MQHDIQHNHYPRFFLMLAASFILMYVVMYLNTYAWDHVYFSLMRFYMTCLMVLPMGLLMLGFMRSMYPRRGLNMFIGGAASALFVGVYFLMRNPGLCQRHALDGSHDSAPFHRYSNE